MTRLRGSFALPDAPLWKYVSLPTLLELINGRLFFGSPRLQIDTHEGYPPLPFLANWLQRWQTEQLHRLADWTPGTRASAERIGKMQQHVTQLTPKGLVDDFRRSTALNCWQIDDGGGESFVMWQAYASRGSVAAIVSSTARLVDALADERYRDQEDIFAFVGRVVYPSSSEELPLSDQDINALTLGFIKRPAFRDEREARIAVSDLSWDFEGPDRPPDQQGKLFQVDPTIYIQRIVVSPFAHPWEYKAIQEAIGRLDNGLGARVEHSALLTAPWR